MEGEEKILFVTQKYSDLENASYISLIEPYNGQHMWNFRNNKVTKIYYFWTCPWFKEIN